MTRKGTLRLGFALHGVGPSWCYWRHPDAVVDPCVNFEFYRQQARSAEAGKLDFLFVADSLFITPQSSPHYLNCLEPIALMSALAAVTSRIGLVATVSVSFSEPYTVARQLASIDHVSGGRAGWNLVTSWLEGSASNYSRESLLEHDLRYELASEYLDVVKGLWDSWEPDALLRDKASGVLFDARKLHALNHKGRFFSVKGPLNIARTPQGQPVIFQAGASNTGRNFAARYADAVFVGAATLYQAQDYYRNVKQRAVGFGRSPEELLLLPPIRPIVGRTAAEVEEKYQLLTQLMPIDQALQALGRTFDGFDFSKLPLDEPLREVDRLSSSIDPTARFRLKRMVQQERLSLRQIALRFSQPDRTFVGTPTQVADTLQQWYEEGAADGFIFYESLPDGLREFVELVVPILQERKLFRSDYEHSTFRGNLGLPEPVNRYVSCAAEARSAQAAS